MLQVAANQKGIQLVTELIVEFGLRKVHAYMHHIQVRASTKRHVQASSDG